MKFKVLLLVLMVFILTFSGLSVYAEDWNITLKAGDKSKVSDSYTKYYNKGYLYYFPQAKNRNYKKNWPKGVKVNFRARTRNKSYASNISTNTGARETRLYYYNGQGQLGKTYRLASNLPKNKKCKKVNLYIYWAP